MTANANPNRMALAVAGLMGVGLPVAAMFLATTPAALLLHAGAILAAGLMAVGMIGTAAVGRFRLGLVLALMAGLGLVLLVRAVGFGALPHPFSTGLAVILACCSFAARGVLFARALGPRGWQMALFVVAGEAATLMATATLPGVLPQWLLALLPAQWASMAFNTALLGTGTRAASSALYALAGTAAATLLVARLLPRKWPYAIMFTTWLALSALVMHRPVAPLPVASGAPAAAIGLGSGQAGDAK
jgi:hypothetical protein